MSQSQSSDDYFHDTPPEVKTREDIIDEIMGEVTRLLNLQQFSIAAECRPPPSDRLSPYEQEALSKKATDEAAPKLFQDLLSRQLLNTKNRPPAFIRSIVKSFTTPFPEQVFPDETLKKSQPLITNNAAEALGNKLSKHAGVDKDHYKAKETFVGLSKIKYNLANFNSMSDLEKKKIFRDFHNKALLVLINFLISKGIEIARMEDMKRRINTSGLSLSFDEIFRFMHTYIEYKYRIAAPPITSSAALVQFITSELLFLSNVMSPYYGASKHLIDFRIYLPLIRIYIKLILRDLYVYLKFYINKYKSFVFD